ncbi:MAG: NADH:ubiquinone reductase (Na(+)-transporting) subunit C [Bacteroidales bacterium]|jgi:Na+-transporting NADH:ubiquinone oxidoreductase subunit C|nr:NADH:ubiquinone reductase (Na(+)-transporting) subunit C [Bacteroidales bacterium]MCI1734060.1 NADH:ubiquinone reductase (Na(+)-transporting) subunit C [Bacteroidales bacterium]
MDTNKNSYTIIYSTVLVVIVAAVLALVSMGLKAKQQTNIDVEKQLSMLGSANLAKDVKNAPNKNTYVENEFNKYFVKGLVINAKGEIIKSDSTNLVKSEAFQISPEEQYEIMKKIAAATSDSEKDKLMSQLRLPVFVCKTADGKEVSIFSCYGPGLWGPIWGYISLQDDFRTVYGALYDHKSETPGLGAEIVTDKFRGQFSGKEIFKDNTLVSVKVVKGGAKDHEHEVDALSGATITSTAVQTMLMNWLQYYLPYIQKNKDSKDAADKAEFIQTENAAADSLIIK